MKRKGFLSGLREDMEHGKELKKFVRLYPNAEKTAKMNFLDIVRAASHIQNHHGFSKTDSVPWSDFSKAEKKVYKRYEKRFDSSNPPDPYNWVREVENEYGYRF